MCWQVMMMIVMMMIINTMIMIMIDHEYHDYDDDDMIIAAAECVPDFQNFSRLLSFDNSFTLAWSVTFDFF